MPYPIVAGMIGGAVVGAGAAAAFGPEDEPMWKKLLVGGSLGAVGGGLAGGAGVLGGGAGGAGAGGTAVAAGSVPTAGATVAPALLPAAAPATGSGVLAVGSGAAPVVPQGGILAGAMNPGVTPAINPAIAPMGPAGSGVLGSAPSVGPMQGIENGLGSIFRSGPAKMAADSPLLTATGLGVAGALALPGGDNDDGDGAGYYEGDPSWDEFKDRRLASQFTGFNGGVGRSYFS